MRKQPRKEVQKAADKERRWVPLIGGVLHLVASIVSWLAGN